MPEGSVGTGPSPVFGMAFFVDNVFTKENANKLGAFVARRFSGEIGVRTEPAAVDKKVTEVILEKLLTKTPMIGATLDTLFDSSKLNTSAEIPHVDAQGNSVYVNRTVAGTVGTDGGKQKATMLPMHRADP